MSPVQAALFVALVAGLWAADVYYLDWGIATFLGKQLLRITDWMAFWR